MKQLFLLLLPACLLVHTSCSTLTTIAKNAASSILTEGEVVGGLKEALSKGATNAVSQAGQQGGFANNALLALVFPPEVKRVEETLRSLGMNQLVDDFNGSVNRAAELAAAQAQPVLVGAVRDMSIADGWGILRGGPNAATQYLQTATTAQLMEKFKPIVDNQLGQANATQYWGDILTVYNKIPFVQPINTDLSNYVTTKTVEGLFRLIGQEEAKIRQNPAERTSALLKKVFSNTQSQ